MEKGPNAYRTISEVAGELSLPQHVLRFWETRFSQIRPLKRSGGRRYYRPNDIRLLHGIRHLLYEEGYTIKGAQRILRERGVGFVVNLQAAGDKMSDSSQISGQLLDAASMDINAQGGRFDSSGDNSQIVSSDLPQLDLDLNLNHDSMMPGAAQIDDDEPLAGGSEMEPPVTRGRKLMRKILGSDGADGRLSAVQLETLQETIGELLSCKRMLDGHHDT